MPAGGTAASVNRQSATPTRQAAADALSPVAGVTGGGTTFDAVVNPATRVRLVTGAEVAGAGAAGGAGTKGGPAGRSGRQRSSGAPATPAAPLAGTPASISTGAGGDPSGGTGSGGETMHGRSGGASSSGGSGGSGTTPGEVPASGGNTARGSVNISAGAPTAPVTNVPPAPSSLGAHSEGSFTLVVPGSDRVSKKRCLSGTAANKCQTITVPALRPVELTVNSKGPHRHRAGAGRAATASLCDA